MREVAARRELYRALPARATTSRCRRARLVLGAQGTLRGPRSERRSPPRRAAVGERMRRPAAAASVRAVDGDHGKQAGAGHRDGQGSRPLWSSVAIVAMWMTVLGGGPLRRRHPQPADRCDRQLGARLVAIVPFAFVATILSGAVGPLGPASRGGGIPRQRARRPSGAPDPCSVRPSVRGSSRMLRTHHGPSVGP